MAIYGVGAYYDRDVRDVFFASSLVGVGWNGQDAPELQKYFRSLKVGDIVYIKAAFGHTDIKVKGIGIIRDTVIRTDADTDTDGLVSAGRNVVWLNRENFVIPRPAEKNNVRSNTVYEEFNPLVQKEIIERIAGNETS
jgi:hypothetical protein